MTINTIQTGESEKQIRDRVQLLITEANRVAAEAAAIPAAYAAADVVSAASTLAAAIASALATHQPIMTNDVKELFGDGVPAATARATLNVNPAGDENGLTFTAVAYGEIGNSVSIRYLDPAANDAALSVTVSGYAITVNLATGVAGAITSTAALIKAAIEAKAEAVALATVAIMTGDTGAVDDGSGIVTAMAVANLAGGTGVGEAVAGIGSRYTDYTNGKLYINGGTKAVPVWNIVTSA